jgi:signal transduction histidine kinase
MFVSEGEDIKVDKDRGTTIFRIVQEALNLLQPGPDII